MNYCADLANGGKHLRLDRPRKRAKLWRFDVIQNDSDRSTLTAAKQLADDEVRAEKKVIGGEVFITTAHYVVASPQGTPFGSTVELARRAVQDWKDLLKKHGLPI